MLGSEISGKIANRVIYSELQRKRYGQVQNMLDFQHDYKTVDTNVILDSERLRMEIIAENIKLKLAKDKMKDLCS